MLLFTQLDQKIATNGGLIVSCQPISDSPLGRSEIVVVMALATEQTGTVAIHIEGVANLQTTHMAVSMPITGTVKHNLGNSPIRITAYIEDVDALAQAGADIIATSGTDRPCPVPVGILLVYIHHHGLLAMTNCSTPEDGLTCQGLGAEITDTMLSDYTIPETPEESDLAPVRVSSNVECRVIAEGRYNTPAQVADAVRHGTWAVTVGSAVTHLEHVCQ